MQARRGNIRFIVLVLAVALALAAPTAAHAQAAQAVGLAEVALGIAFGVMFPAPQCGPHDQLPPPYQPARPNYGPPPQPDQHANLEQHNNFDDDDDFEDDFAQPVHHHPPRHLDSNYSRQSQTRPDAQDESDQRANLRARDGDQPAVSADDEQQPVTAPARRRPHRRHQPQTEPVEQTQSSGQMAEIPSLSQPTQASPRTGGFAPEQ
jgi:hypothetical protein